MIRITGAGGVVSYKPTRQYDMEDLAAQVHIQPSSGVLFTRATMRTEKEAARARILDLFTPQAWPGSLRILTMPGAGWRFERLLLRCREVGWMQRKWPRRTLFTSVENDRAVGCDGVRYTANIATKSLRKAQNTINANGAEKIFAVLQGKLKGHEIIECGLVAQVKIAKTAQGVAK